MNQFTITKERKIILAIGVLFLLIGVGYRFLPLNSATLDRGEEIALEKRNIQKYRLRVAQMDDLQKRIRQARIILEKSEKILLDGETEALAAVNIQNIINQITTANGVQVASTRVLKAEKLSLDSFTGIRIEITFITTIRNIQEIIYRIENNEKWLAIRQLNLNVPSEKDPENISARLEVMGVMKKM